MTNRENQRRLRNMLILPGFQGRLVLLIFLAGFVSIALNGYLYYSYMEDNYNYGVVTLLVMLIIMAWALFISHRAAGAVYNMGQVIEAIRAGDTTRRIHLRKKDEFQQIAKSFNLMMDELQKK